MIFVALIAVGVAALLESGCAESSPKKPTRPPPPPPPDGGDNEEEPCPGSAFRSTKVVFQDGSAPADEQADIRRRLEEFERPIRAALPSLFCHFNGYAVGEEQGQSFARYDQSTHVIHLRNSLGALHHEFCHHADYEYSSLHGRLASRDAPWRGVSCFFNGLRNENCMTNATQVSRGPEEEFADSCARTIPNPPGAVLNFAAHESTRKQAATINEALGLKPERVAAVLDTLQPPRSVSVTGALDPLGLTIPRETGEWLLQNPERFHGGVVPTLYPLRDHAFGYFISPTTFRINRPGSSHPSGWETYDVTMPEDFDYQETFSLDYQGGEVFLHYRDRISSFSSVADRVWREAASDASLTEPGGLAVVEGVPVYFSQNTITSFLAGSPHREGYPEELGSDLGKGGRIVRVFSEEGAYLWVRNIPSPGEGLVSKLFQVTRDPESPETSGILHFEKMLEFPETEASSLPLLYQGKWHIIDRVPNSYLSSRGTSGYPSYLQSSYPVILRLEEGGRRITPLEPQYPADDPQDPLHVGISASASSILVSGNKFVGVSPVLPSRTPRSEVIERPIFVSFQF